MPQYCCLMVKVKICGITNRQDALNAIACGADALGFLVGQMHASRSVFISAEAARGIAEALPPFCSSVLVTHLAAPDDLLSLAITARVTTIQLHGNTTPDEAVRIRTWLPNVKVYKAIHVTNGTALAHAKTFVGKVDAIILDTAIPEKGMVGGTGKTHDWNLSRAIVESVPLPAILAGGLTPENVQEAIRIVQPYAVDVNSGVSYSDGTKDPQKLRQFILNAKTEHG
jgi:phosphoribosylanthranilate isomerase